MSSATLSPRSIAELIDAGDDLHIAGLSQPSFRLLVENTADGILVVDPEGAVLYANPAATEIFGQPREQLLRVPLGRPVVSDETAAITIHRPGRPEAEVEMRVVDVTWDGRPALLANLRDVSAQRARAEQRQQSAKMEAIGRIAAGVAHDFNNLLAVIDSGVRLLETQIADDPSDPKVGVLIDELRKRIQNGGAILQQLLAFSRRQTLSPRVLDLNGHIKSLAEMLTQALGERIVVQTNLDPHLGPVHIDVNQFEVAILNLAVNARDAMSGAGTFTVETSSLANGLGNVSNARGRFIRVSVRDTGCGMSPQTLEQVFEPFFTTKRDGHGTGLGLSQVYGFISQSGGHIRIESEVGSGTSVHLFLPRAAQPSGD